ncbi:MAG: DUF5979 domain-containing protein [Propionicimonas sp.]|uniref:DUF5979 domain-containing protein n=1 Tax=Propionicimonas sp. TaxID=1955623 RepID=UPI003D13D3BA
MAALLLALASTLLAPVPAHAEDPALLTLNKGVTGWLNRHHVSPGDTFVYTLTITCTNIGSGGCTAASLRETLPDGISLDGGAGAVAVQPSGAGSVDLDGGEIVVDFTQRLADPLGARGIQAGTTITVQVPVQVDDLPADRNGDELSNRATVDATNASPASDSFTVVADVATQLRASTDKSFEPSSAVASPGTGTRLALRGGNASNVGVDAIVMTDPTDPPGAFRYLGLTGDLDVDLPRGAEQVQVDCFLAGAWEEGTPGAPPARLPAGVDDPPACSGIRVHFLSTDGADIPPGASGSLSAGLTQRSTIVDAGEGPIHNVVSTTVSAGGDTSDAVTASDDYTITSGNIAVGATKSFAPSVIAAGSSSTVTVGATNASSRTLDSLSITEPGTAPNMFESGVRFDGWGSVAWPRGATGARVDYRFSDGTTQTLAGSDEGTLPGPPSGRVVVGFTVTFTGPIVPGAEATIPFVVTAADSQGSDEVQHPNIVAATSTAPGGYAGSATAQDTLTTVVRRVDIAVSKRVVPGRIFSIPGQTTLAELGGRLRDFPASTTSANRIIVQDPTEPGADAWYGCFAPTGVVQTPIPAGATLSVQYWNGTQWVDVPGQSGLAGPQVFSGGLPADVTAGARGIRFVYDSDAGLPPGSQVNPNVAFELKADCAGEDIDVPDCAAATATSPDGGDAAARQEGEECPRIDLVPPNPGNADFIDKGWDAPKAVGERTEATHGATLRWSTSGATGIDQMRISDVPDPSVAGLPQSAFDRFDLVRIDPITASMDPALTYDRVERVELFSAAAGAWLDAPGDPCPSACDGTFPGYTLSATARADTIAFRLVFGESPSRQQRIGDDPSAPAVGSGVARSSGNDRRIHPVFQLRDDLRSDPAIPVLADRVHNVADEAGEVLNTIRAEVLVDGAVYVSQDASDIITITPVNVTADLTKQWTGGPLGVPAAGTAVFPADYPTGRVTLRARNTTPRRVDRLTISEPTGTSDPFEVFNLRGFTTISTPASIGATDVVVVLQQQDGGSRVISRAQALAATETELADVVGFSVVYTGRIVAAGTAVISVDTRVRDVARDGGRPVAGPVTVRDEASAEAADLIDYPGVAPRTSTDTAGATIDLRPAGIGLQVDKAITPAELTEPSAGPVAVRLTGRPSGPSRAVWMELTDSDPRFSNAYDFAGFGAFSFAAPINRVQVDAFVDATYSSVNGQLERTGGRWVDGTPGTGLVLPAGVGAGDVQGLRFTFTRADGALWENPSTPLQVVNLVFERRATLRSGGPVLSDVPGNPALPGEREPGVSTNAVHGQDRAADTIGGLPLTASDDAVDTVVYRHSRNAVTVAKSPTGAQPPGADIPYRLTFTNSGDTPITDPVITDRFPSDADGSLLVYSPTRTGPGTGYTFALTGAAPSPSNGTALPEDPAAVTVAETPTGVTFTFPAGAVLEVGQTYTISMPLQFRTGLAGNTPVTNTTGITGTRPWDGCVQTLDPATGECTARTTVRPTRGGALRGEKFVRAVDPALGVLNTRGDANDCRPDADGFSAGGCVPVTRPGGDEVWRLRFTNTGNLPQDRVYAIDRLPTPGDTGSITALTRDSAWTPIPRLVRFAGVSGGEVSAVRVYYDTDQDLCTDDLNLGESCPLGTWTLLTQVDDPVVGSSIALPENATAIKIEADFFTRMFQPNGRVEVDLVTTTPAVSPTAGADPIAWNTVAVAARTDDGGTRGLSPKSEGNKVGVALATGPLAVEKVVRGPAAAFAPDSFSLTVHCTSGSDAGQARDVPLPDGGRITVVPGEPYRLDNLPLGSLCTASEDSPSSGNPVFTATTATVARADQPVATVLATNTYPAASLVLTKRVEGSAVDANGDPLRYGPFRFGVSCSYRGQPVFADGYSAEHEMTASFSSGESASFTGLPAGAACTATETDAGAASSTRSEGTASDRAPIAGDRTLGPLVLAADGPNRQATNTGVFTNTFATGSLTITKQVTGAGASAYGTGPFTVRLACVAADDPGRTVYLGDHVLGGANGLVWDVTNLYAPASCDVTEPSTGGATDSAISPEGPFLVGADVGEGPAVVTVTNRFDTGAISLHKRVHGAVDAGTRFGFRLSCTRDVDGTPTPVALPDGGVATLSAPDDLATVFDHLPAGARCTLSETASGGATSTRIEPATVTVRAGTTVDVVATNTFPGGELSYTGSEPLPLIAAGLLLLLAGGTMLRSSQRRRRG